MRSGGVKNESTKKKMEKGGLRIARLRLLGGQNCHFWKLFREKIDAKIEADFGSAKSGPGIEKVDFWTRLEVENNWFYSSFYTI